MRELHEREAAKLTGERILDGVVTIKSPVEVALFTLAVAIKADPHAVYQLLKGNPDVSVVRDFWHQYQIGDRDA